MDFLRKIFNRKASAAGHMLVERPFQEHEPNRNYKALSEEGYRKNAAVKRCIDYISLSVADVKLNLFSKKSELEITGHELLSLLDNPNPTQCYEEYMRSLISFFMLHGNMYSEAVYGSTVGLNPMELWVQRSDRMSVVPGDTGIPYAYVLKNNGKKFTWHVDQVKGTSPILHVKTFNPLDDYYGMSFLESAAFSVDQYNQAMIWNVSLLKNSARPSGAFVVEKSGDPNFQGLTNNQRNQVRSEIDEIYTGSGNSGRPMLLEGGLNYVEMGLSPKDMDWIESKNTSVRDICMAFGVPPQLVGVTGDSTYANYEQARIAFYDSSVVPLARLVAKSLTRWLTPMYKNGEMLELRPDIDSIEALAPRRRAKWDMISSSTFLTTNEKRVETGFGRYEPSDDPADQIFINASAIPIDFASDFGGGPPEDTEDITGVEKDNNELEDAKKSTELKVFNINNEKKKRQFWLQQNRKMKKSETRMRNKIAVALIKEGKMLAKQLDGTDPLVWSLITDEVLEETSAMISKAISSSLEPTMREFGKQVVSGGKGLGVDVETKNSEARFESFLNNYIKTNTAESVKNISKTTRGRLKKLFKTLSESEDDLPSSVVAAKVGNLYKGFTPSRALTIARTESHNAAMSAQLKAAENLGVPNLKKEWISSMDDRSRSGDGSGPDHVSMNGVTIDTTDKFEVHGGTGTDYMDGPGDPSAPAAQVINCRCVLAFSSGV